MKRPSDTIKEVKL